MDFETKQKLKDFLFQLISENKQQKFSDTVAGRTRYITVVLEDLYQSHNASAVLRTCDCFGVQDVHIIENAHRFQIAHEIVRGASKWLTIQKYNLPDSNNTEICLKSLKNKGYQIIGTTPHIEDTNLEEMDLTSPIALVFGTEKKGLSTEARKHCDGYMKVPMYGFTESLNISVCAGISLHHLIWKIRQSNISWQLSPEEQLDLMIEWAFQVTGNRKQLKAEFLKTMI
ncbi:MAG: RNA methyltransferase [Flavobacteriales bacterium]|nr:RNA methyltransferase [Flavobacteriales bacterium]